MLTFSELLTDTLEGVVLSGPQRSFRDGRGSRVLRKLSPRPICPSPLLPIWATSSWPPTSAVPALPWRGWQGADGGVGVWGLIQSRTTSYSWLQLWGHHVHQECPGISCASRLGIGYVHLGHLFPSSMIPDVKRSARLPTPTTYYYHLVNCHVVVFSSALDGDLCVLFSSPFIE